MNLIPIDSPRFLSGEELPELPEWTAIFGNANPLALEIGCGVGDFITDMASQHPGINFIALDYYNKGCLKTCRRIDAAGLNNVRVVRDEARGFITRCLQPGTLQRLIINCPDPWPKLRHRKRRLVNREFIGFIDRYLCCGADVYFSTDFEDYGEDVGHMMPQVPGFSNQLAPELWRHELQGYPLSKYMRKFMAEGKKIYFVHYRKSQGS